MARLAERPASIRVTYRGSDGVSVDTTLDQVVVADLAAGLPVREFRSYKGRRHYSGWYWSATMSQLVAYESRLELARVILADFDPRVVAIAAQPFRLVGPDGSRIRRHVPDLLLVDVDGAVTVVDVKSPHKRTDESVQALMAWTDRTVALRGWSFEACYEAPPCLLTNVTFLAGYRRRSVVDATLFPAIRSAVGDGRSIVEVERVVGLERVASVRPAILHLLWSGGLVTDLTRPLGGASVVRIAAGSVR